MSTSASSRLSKIAEPSGVISQYLDLGNISPTWEMQAEAMVSKFIKIKLELCSLSTSGVLVER